MMRFRALVLGLLSVSLLLAGCPTEAPGDNTNANDNQDGNQNVNQNDNANQNTNENQNENENSNDNGDGSDGLTVRIELRGLSGNETRMRAYVLVADDSITRDEAASNADLTQVESFEESSSNHTIAVASGQTVTIIAYEFGGLSSALSATQAADADYTTVPSFAHEFVSFSGDVESIPEAGVCVLSNLQEDKTVRVNYERMRSVLLEGLGSGEIEVQVDAPDVLYVPAVANPVNGTSTFQFDRAGGDAPGVHIAYLKSGATIRYAAHNASGQGTFMTWGGDCSAAGSNTSCTLTFGASNLVPTVEFTTP